MNKVIKQKTNNFKKRLSRKVGRKISTRSRKNWTSSKMSKSVEHI